MTDKNSDAPKSGIPASGMPAGSPFREALTQKPADLAREAERVMDSPQREEVAAAQAEKTAAADKGKTGSLGETVDANVRSPLDRQG